METFKKKAEAEIDDARVLTEMARGIFVDRSEAESMTVDVMLNMCNMSVTLMTNPESPERCERNYRENFQNTLEHKTYSPLAIFG